MAGRMEIDFDSLSGMSLQTYRAYVPESVGPLNPGRRPREGMPSPELFIGDPYRKKIVEVVNGVLRLPYFEGLEKWYSRNQVGFVVRIVIFVIFSSIARTCGHG